LRPAQAALHLDLHFDGLNREWNSDILVSAETIAACGVEMPEKAMPPAVVKGMLEPIRSTH
jgi:hypothetical protein